MDPRSFNAPFIHAAQPRTYLMNPFWQDCLSRLAADLPTQQFNTWIKPLKLADEAEIPRLLAPNRFVLDWVREKFQPRIETLALHYFGQPTEIEISLNEQRSTTPLNSKANVVSQPTEIKAAIPVTPPARAASASCPSGSIPPLHLIVLSPVRPTSWRVLRPFRSLKIRVLLIIHCLFMAAWAWVKPT